VVRLHPVVLALAVILLLSAVVGAQQDLQQVPQCLVAIGDPLVNAEFGVTDEVATFGVLVSEDKVLVPLLAVTERSLRINSGKDEVPNPVVGGDQMLDAGKELTAVQRVPMHVWDAEAKKVHTMEATLVGMDRWRSLALYQLPEKFPGRAALLYEGDVPDGLRVTCHPPVSFSLKGGPGAKRPLSAVLKTRAVSQGEAQRDWGVIFDAGWSMRGAGVFADGKLVGIIPEFTHYRIEISPSHPEKRGPAVYVILAGRIREFLREQKVL